MKDFLKGFAFALGLFGLYTLATKKPISITTIPYNTNSNKFSVIFDDKEKVEFSTEELYQEVIGY